MHKRLNVFCQLVWVTAVGIQQSVTLARFGNITDVLLLIEIERLLKLLNHQHRYKCLNRVTNAVLEGMEIYAVYRVGYTKMSIKKCSNQYHTKKEIGIGNWGFGLDLRFGFSVQTRQKF
jgi:hypothetical protein